MQSEYTLELIFCLSLCLWSLSFIFNLFPLISNLFVYFFTFNPYFFFKIEFFVSSSNNNNNIEKWVSSAKYQNHVPYVFPMHLILLGWMLLLLKSIWVAL